MVPDQPAKSPGRQRGVAKKALTPSVAPELSDDSFSGDLLKHHIERFGLKAVSRPLPEDAGQLEFPLTHAFIVVGSAAAVSDGLVAALSLEGYPVIHLKSGKKTRQVSEMEYEVDFTSEKSVSRLTALIDEDIRPGAVINLLNLDTSEPLENGSSSKALFLILKLFASELESSIEEGAGWLINFTLLDGKFGLGRSDASRTMVPEQAGTIGISKSIGREWPGMRVKCIDIEPDIEPHLMLAQVLEELETDNPAIEVGVSTDGRFELELETDDPAGGQSLELDNESVILVTGGAYGITAEFSRYFAQHFQARLVVLGRSPEPVEEDPETAVNEDPADLRNFLIDRARTSDAAFTPAAIEKTLKSILKNREIRNNFAHIRAAGSELSYHSLDIGDAAALSTLINNVYQQYGRIDGIIHGAGIIEDRLLKDKPLESFEAVMATKTVATRVMLASLRPEQLKFVLFFSSVAARFGNVGQSDYCAANEVLNKTALKISNQWPDTRAVSINWGPWKAGMVSESLENLYASKGLNLIPPGIGLRLGVQELFDHGDNEVLIAADTDKISQWGLG